MARNPPEAVGRYLEVLGRGLGAAASRGVGRGFRAGAASKSIHGSAWKNRAPCLSRGAGHLGAAKDRVNCFGIRIARFRQSLKWIRNDPEGISEIKFDRRTESRKEAPRGWGDEQCERAGATRSGSVMDLLSEIVTNEFLALMEVSDRLPGLPMDHLANAGGQIPVAPGADKAAAK